MPHVLEQLNCNSTSCNGIEIVLPGQGGARGGGRVPQRPLQVHHPGGEAAQGGVAGRTSRHWKDHVGQVGGQGLTLSRLPRLGRLGKVQSRLSMLRWHSSTTQGDEVPPP